MAAVLDEDRVMRHPTPPETARWEPDQPAARRVADALTCRGEGVPCFAVGMGQFLISRALCSESAPA